MHARRRSISDRASAPLSTRVLLCIRVIRGATYFFDVPDLDDQPEHRQTDAWTAYDAPVHRRIRMIAIERHGKDCQNERSGSEQHHSDEVSPATRRFGERFDARSPNRNARQQQAGHRQT